MSVMLTLRGPSLVSSNEISVQSTLILMKGIYVLNTYARHLIHYYQLCEGNHRMYNACIYLEK